MDQHAGPASTPRLAGCYVLEARGRVVAADELARMRRSTRAVAAECAALLRLLRILIKA